MVYEKYGKYDKWTVEQLEKERAKLRQMKAMTLEHIGLIDAEIAKIDAALGKVGGAAV